MSIDFAYAQARAQARLGERLSETDWRVLESTLGLAQYLASVRGTALAPLVQHFSPAVTIHAIERTLRDGWRAEVATVSRWVPQPWSPAVAWTTWIAYLDALAWLIREEPVLPWMRSDAVLSDVALGDTAARRLAIAQAPFGLLASGELTGNLQARWLAHWSELCPRASDEEQSGLRLLRTGVARFLADGKLRGMDRNKRRELGARLDALATGLVHRHAEQPAAVFGYLSLVALDLLRLRDGLLRRALFRDAPGEQAA